MSIERDEWADFREEVRRGFAGLNSRLDDLNGRLQQHGEDIAVLQDRSDGAEVSRWIDRGVAALVAAYLTMFRR